MALALAVENVPQLWPRILFRSQNPKLTLFPTSPLHPGDLITCYAGSGDTEWLGTDTGDLIGACPGASARHARRHGARITSLVWYSNSFMLLSGSADATVKLWTSVDPTNLHVSVT